MKESSEEKTKDKAIIEIKKLFEQLYQRFILLTSPPLNISPIPQFPLADSHHTYQNLKEALGKNLLSLDEQALYEKLITIIETLEKAPDTVGLKKELINHIAKLRDNDSFKNVIQLLNRILHNLTSQTLSDMLFLLDDPNSQLFPRKVNKPSQHTSLKHEGSNNPSLTFEFSPSFISLKDAVSASLTIAKKSDETHTVSDTTRVKSTASLTGYLRSSIRKAAATSMRSAKSFFFPVESTAKAAINRCINIILEKMFCASKQPTSSQREKIYSDYSNVILFYDMLDKTQGYREISYIQHSPALSYADSHLIQYAELLEMKEAMEKKETQICGRGGSRRSHRG